MTLKDLLNGVDAIKIKADLSTEITAVAYDSSKIEQGGLFVAIVGYKTDGHKYIEDAVKNGAVCVVCQTKPEIDIAYIKVKNTRRAMSLISAAWFGYPSSKLKLIGVTGTNGKTTITYMIKHMLESCKKCKVGLIGTIENLIGDRIVATALTTPDSFELHKLFNEMVKEGCEYVIMEVSSHALYLDRVHGIAFDIGIFTNLTNDHLDFHETMEAYSDAKAILFKNCKHNVINIDDKYAEKMIKNSFGTLMTYAVENIHADILGGEIQLCPAKTVFNVHYDNKDCRAEINIPGAFTVYNTLAAIGAGLKTGLSLIDISKALETFNGVRGRAEVMQLDEDFTVLVDYAHTPDALENIIKTAHSIAKGRVHTLFGCGGDRDKTKRPMMGRLAMELSDFVIITSDNPRTENPEEIIRDILAGIDEETRRKEQSKEGLKVITDRREAIREALDVLLAGDILLIAGKGHETYQVIGNEKIHFDDREIVMEHLRQTAKKKRRIHHAV